MSVWKQTLLRLAAPLLGLWLLGCQAVETLDTTPTPSLAPVVSTSTATSSPTAATTTIAPSPTAEATEESSVSTMIEGNVIAESDVSGQPDTPLADQLVIAVPEAVVTARQGAPLSERDLRFLGMTFSEQEGAMTRTDDEGHYELAVPPGAHILCLADSSGAGELTTRGCGRVILEPGERYRVNISSGFGEILLVEP